MTRVLAAGAGVVALTGCAGLGDPSGASATLAPTSVTSATSPMPTLTVRPRADVDAAVADLARREGVAVADVRVAGLEDVRWSDSSLGCPEPGRAYAQGVVDGQRLTLEVRDRRFAYHQGGEQPFTFCAVPAPRPSG